MAEIGDPLTIERPGTNPARKPTRLPPGGVRLDDSDEATRVPGPPPAQGAGQGGRQFPSKSDAATKSAAVDQLLGAPKAKARRRGRGTFRVA